jgi:peptidoglycan/LPS O-acetylase OafA/YrhL
MSLINPLPYFVLMTIFLLVGYWVVRLTLFFSRECGPASAGRYEAIDGLRGYLALGVFFTHAVLSYHWHETGKWGGQPTGIYGPTGHIAVAIFFIITGFLFWGKVLRASGRVDWKALYISRFLRLTPLYLFSVALVLSIVAIKTGFEMNVSLRRLALEIFSWLTFSILEPMNVNGLKNTERINAGVLWTLAYEWKFYLALPLLALFRRAGMFVLLAAAFISLYVLVPSERIVVNFLIGMLVAYAVGKSYRADVLQGRVASFVALGCMGSLLLPLEEMRVWLEPPFLLVAFMIIAHGNRLFGLLTHPAAKYLGTVSYSIYLLHGIFLYVSLQLLNSIAPIAMLEPLQYWAWMALVGVLIVLACGVTYRFVEHPFLVRKPAIKPRSEPMRETEGNSEVRDVAPAVLTPLEVPAGQTPEPVQTVVR